MTWAVKVGSQERAASELRADGQAIWAEAWLCHAPVMWPEATSSAPAYSLGHGEHSLSWHIKVPSQVPGAEEAEDQQQL